MQDSSNTSQLSSSWASGESLDDLSLLGDLSFSFDSGVSVSTTLVEDILSEFPITQDSLGSTSTTDATSELQGSKTDAYNPLTVSDLASDGPQCPDCNVLAEPVEAITTADAAPMSESTQERLKELWARRFTHPRKMTPSYAWGGR